MATRSDGSPPNLLDGLQATDRRLRGQHVEKLNRQGAAAGGFGGGANAGGVF